jgi:NtrC-family two-component system sensor histidine kinase KinB
MLREEAGAFEGRRSDILDAAIVGCEDLGRTIDELLDLSRVESGQLRLMKERVDLNGLVGQLISSYRPRFIAAGIDLAHVSESRQAVLLADGPRLAVVLSNLLSNALKYTPSGGRVEVHLSTQNTGAAAGQCLQIAVSDTGPGVPEEFRERIFDKFFRIEHQSSKSAVPIQGAGFGLYLCRQIIEAHEGKIHCTRGSGQTGTTIAFEIPATAEAGSVSV